jgi:hypothetical protein
MHSYKDETIQMQIKQGFLDRIIIGKGSKQECALNSSLFNLWIDPLIRDIKSNYQEYGYRYDGDKRK